MTRRLNALIYLYFLGCWLEIFTCMQLMLIAFCQVRALVTQWLSFPISSVLLAFLSHFLFPVPVLKKSPFQTPILPARSIAWQCPGSISFPPLILSPVPPVSLLLWLLLFSLSAVRPAASLATMPGYPGGTCNYISRAAGLGPCPDLAFPSKHSSKNYE